MQALVGVLAAPSPADDSASLAASELVWAAARRRVLEPSAARLDPAEVAAAVDALAAWRRTVASFGRDVRACGFVATCLARLAVQDAVAGRHAALPPPASRLERSAWQPFEPLARDAALQAMRRASTRWAAEDFAGWAALAYAACVAKDEDDVLLDESFLDECAAFDVACAGRCLLEDALVDDGELLRRDDEAADVAALDAWVRRSTKNANDELFELGREACAWCFLTPAEYAAEAGTSSERIARGALADRATEVYTLCKDGFNALGRDAAMDDSLALHLVDYKARQLVGVPFLQYFVLSDLASLDALRALRAREALAAPPPRLLRLRSEWLVVGKALRVRARSGRFAPAFFAWMHFVRTECDGCVFFKKVQPLADDIASDAPVLDGPATRLPTERL